MGPYRTLIISYEAVVKLFIIAASVIVLSIVTGLVLSLKKAKKANESLWNPTSKRLLINFLIPLLTGGFFIIFLIEKEILSLVAPLMLIFYGMACLNASKYTIGDVRYLGITLIILGLLLGY